VSTDGDAFKAKVHEAIARADDALMQSAARDCDFITMEADSFPPTLFEWLLERIRMPEVLAMDGSWPLLYIFDSNWELLGDEERSRLLITLESLYSRFEDWMSCFTITELLGDRYADRRALEALERLSSTPSAVQRSLIPHGFEHLALGADPRVAAEALTRLQAMARDPSEQVRDEVAKSLQKVTRGSDGIRWQPDA
jgi:hypothetical protein